MLNKMCWRFCFCMIHNANKFINLIITHLSVNVKQDVADKVMAIKNRFMDKHICSWQKSSMSNLWLSMLLLLEYQQLYTIFTLFCHCMSKFPNTKCLFFIYLNGYLLLIILCKYPFSENGLYQFSLTFFKSYPHLGLINIFTYSLHLSFWEAEHKIRIIESLILCRSISEETIKEESEGSFTWKEVKDKTQGESKEKIWFQLNSSLSLIL